MAMVRFSRVRPENRRKLRIYGLPPVHFFVEYFRPLSELYLREYFTLRFWENVYFLIYAIIISLACKIIYRIARVYISH